MSDTQQPEAYHDDDDLPEPPKWPKPVGITSIVFASLGLICNGCGVFGSLASDQMYKMAEPQLGPAPDVLKPTAAVTVISMLGFLWAILLLIAGILTLTRNYAGRLTHIVYSIGGILLISIGTYLQLEQQAAFKEWARQNPDSQWVLQVDNPIGMISMVVGILIGLSWPLFCLIWFGFIKKTREDFTGGVEPVV